MWVYTCVPYAINMHAVTCLEDVQCTAWSETYVQCTAWSETLHVAIQYAHRHLLGGCAMYCMDMPWACSETLHVAIQSAFFGTTQWPATTSIRPKKQRMPKSELQPAHHWDSIVPPCTHSTDVKCDATVPPALALAQRWRSRFPTASSGPKMALKIP